MNKEEVMKKLEGVMDAVSVCEGLIYAKIKGEVLVGQTLTEMDHGKIAKKAGELLSTSIPAAELGNITDFTIGLEKGSIIAVKKNEEMVIGLLGSDGKASVGLLTRQLKNIMK